MLNHKALRRQYEAAKRDRQPGRFVDNLTEALEKRQLVGEDFSLRALFEEFVDDGREIVDSWNPRRGGDGVNLFEAAGAIDSGLFANISGQIVYNRILEYFAQEEFVFSKLVPTQSTQFNGEKIAGITGLGDESATIGEGQPYPLVGVGEDWIETPATTKRGMIVPITKEAIFFDRTGQLLNECRKVGESLGVNKEKRVIDVVIDENTTAGRYRWKGTQIATYDDNTGSHTWDNLQASNALQNWTDVEAAELLLSSITDPNTGEPVIVMPKHLMVTKQLEHTAKYILNATDVRKHSGGYATSGELVEYGGANTLTSYQIVTSRLLAARMATDTSWYLGDIGRAFVYMENWPITVVQAPANSHDEFHRDIVQQFKASERGATATMEPRAMVKNTVA